MARGDKAFYFVLGLLLLFLALFVVLPVVLTFCSIGFGEVFSVLCQRQSLVALGNTLAICFSASAISVVVGFLYAYCVKRLEVPFVAFFKILPIIHLVTPPVASGMSFLLLFGRNGFITKAIFHSNLSLYGFWGIVIAQVLYFFPVAYLVCSVSLDAVNKEHEAQSYTLGAGRVRVFFTVTVSESWGGIISSFLLIAVSSMSDFGNPVLVGGRCKVLSTVIYSVLTGAIERQGAVALSLMLLFPSLILFVLQAKYFFTNKKRLEVAGDNSALITLPVSTGVKIAATGFCAFFCAVIIAEALSLVIGSFQKLWGVDATITTLHVKSLAKYSGAFLNSISFSLVASVLTVFVSSLTAFYSHGVKDDSGSALKALRAVTDILAQAPQSVCSVVMGLCYSLSASALHFKGSAFLIILVMTISMLPYAHKNIAASFLQQKPSLYFAAITLGASKLGSLRTVLLRESALAIMGSFLYTFARCMGTLSAIIFLVGFGTKTVSLYILNTAGQGDWGASCALSTALSVITLSSIGLAWVAYKIFERHPKNKRV